MFKNFNKLCLVLKPIAEHTHLRAKLIEFAFKIVHLISTAQSQE